MWGDKLLEFVKTAVDNVRPSSRVLNDTMNFNTFIKIKIVNYVDNSQSKYVNGIVLNNNLADKRMKEKIKNPKIFLLKGSLDFQEEDIANII